MRTAELEEKNLLIQTSEELLRVEKLCDRRTGCGFSYSLRGSRACAERAEERLQNHS